jgi:hypothetical protein
MFYAEAPCDGPDPAPLPPIHRRPLLIYKMAAMKTHSPSPPEALAQWIRSIFREGLILDANVVRYMESAFGTRDIQAVLRDAPDSDTGPLLELLCFPDRDLRLRFEARWGDNAFTADDRRAVIAQLGRSPLSAEVRSTSGKLLGSIDIPPFVLETVVARLKITRPPPPQLTRAIARYCPPERNPEIRVYLRHAGLPWHTDQIRLMERFLCKMSVESNSFEEHLTFLLSILSELMPGADIRDFLVAKKRFYFKALCRAENFERRRRSSNMEIMILQGARAAHGDIETWRGSMRGIDTICRALFGETPFFQRPEQDGLHVGQGNIELQIQNVIRILAE